MREEIGLGNCFASSGVWFSTVLSRLISSELFGKECPWASASPALLYSTLLKTKDEKDASGHHVPSLLMGNVLLLGQKTLQDPALANCSRSVSGL